MAYKQRHGIIGKLLNGIICIFNSCILFTKQGFTKKFQPAKNIDWQVHFNFCGVCKEWLNWPCSCYNVTIILYESTKLCMSTLLYREIPNNKNNEILTSENYK